MSSRFLAQLENGSGSYTNECSTRHVNNRCKNGEWAYSHWRVCRDTVSKYLVICTTTSVPNPEHNTKKTVQLAAGVISSVSWSPGGRLDDGESELPNRFAVPRDDRDNVNLTTTFKNQADAPASSMVYADNSVFSAYNSYDTNEVGPYSNAYYLQKAVNSAANVAMLRKAFTIDGRGLQPRYIAANTPVFNALLQRFAFTAALPGSMRLKSLDGKAPDITFLELESDTLELAAGVDPTGLLQPMRAAVICTTWSKTPAADASLAAYCGGTKLLTGVCQRYCSDTGKDCDVNLQSYCSTAGPEANSVCACFRGVAFYEKFVETLAKIFPEATAFANKNPECIYPPCAQSLYQRKAYRTGDNECKVNITQCFNVSNVAIDGAVALNDLAIKQDNNCQQTANAAQNKGRDTGGSGSTSGGSGNTSGSGGNSNNSGNTGGASPSGGKWSTTTIIAVSSGAFLLVGVIVGVIVYLSRRKAGARPRAQSYGPRDRDRSDLEADDVGRNRGRRLDGKSGLEMEGDRGARGR